MMVASGVIPARLESVRLPRKPMLPILGRPMIEWVYHRAREAKSLSRLVVATDSEEIFRHCGWFGIPAVMTSGEHRSGTDRVHEVMRQEGKAGRGADVYLNIQGDEPMVTARHIELLIRPFSQEPRAQVSTLKVAIPLDEARDPNNVKVVTAANGNALYFSRALIPHDRDGTGKVQHFKHLGLYAYSADALERFHSLPASKLEQQERLEQLRFLDNGIPIAVVETDEDTIGVDTKEALRQAEDHLRRSGCAFPGAADI